MNPFLVLNTHTHQHTLTIEETGYFVDHNIRYRTFLSIKLFVLLKNKNNRQKYENKF